MMYKVNFTSKFKKDYKTAKKRGLDSSKLETVINDLINGKKLDEKYRNHILTGNYKGFYECHIEPDWLLIYFIENEILVLTLVRTGSHSDLF